MLSGWVIVGLTFCRGNLQMKIGGKRGCELLQIDAY